MAANKQRKKSKPRLARQRLGAREKDVLGIWEGNVECIGSLLAQAVAINKPTPAEKPEAIIKVQVYQLVRKLLGRRYRNDFENVLLYKMESAPRVSFDANPYYWGLKAIWKDEEINLKGNVISKYAKQLAYAGKHDIPPQLLIGFLYQVGGITRIKGMLNSGAYESWYRNDLSWLTPS